MAALRPTIPVVLPAPVVVLGRVVVGRELEGDRVGLVVAQVVPVRPVEVAVRVQD